MPPMATSRPIFNLTIDQCLELISFGNVMMVSLIITIREFSPGCGDMFVMAVALARDYYCMGIFRYLPTTHPIN